MDISMMNIEERMMAEEVDPRSLLPLTPAVFHILLALAGTDRHGYGIMQEVARATDGQMRLGPGTLYRSIRQMLEAGFIAEADERPDPALDDERRRYYHLTDLGQRVAAAEALRLAALVEQARAKHLISDEGGTLPGGAVEGQK
jgi:DNA-binding PadR family transcriptional regulator